MLRTAEELGVDIIIVVEPNKTMVEGNSNGKLAKRTAGSTRGSG